MTDPQWRYHTPERNGHAPDDWAEGCETEILNKGDWLKAAWEPWWAKKSQYRYRPRPLQDATSPITPEWCLRMAKQEEGDIAAGRLAMDDATVEPSFDTLKDQCLRLPQDQREALIEAMQKPQRDWADDVWDAAFGVWDCEVGSLDDARNEAAAVIRSMCRPKEVELDEAWLIKQAEFIWKEPYSTWPDLLRNLIREALS